jgi:hypothetical protein
MVRFHSANCNSIFEPREAANIFADFLTKWDFSRLRLKHQNRLVRRVFEHKTTYSLRASKTH